MPTLKPEELESLKKAFDSVRCPTQDSVSLFEAEIAFKKMGLNIETSKLFTENKQWDITFDRFCDIYERLHQIQEMKELKDTVIQSFEALGGKPNQQGVIDPEKVKNLFKFFNFDIDPEDFLSRGNTSGTGDILFDDYAQMFDLNSTV